MDLVQHLLRDKQATSDCKQDLLASILCFLGCKSDCIQRHQEMLDSLGWWASNSSADFVVCIEEMHNAMVKLDCSSEMTGCTLSSWASKTASSVNNAALSSLDSTASTAALLVCSLDSKDCSWA